MTNQQPSDPVLTEHQKQGVEFLRLSVQRLYQEGMTPNQVAKMFVDMIDADLESLGMKLVLFVGIPESK